MFLQCFLACLFILLLVWLHLFCYFTLLIAALLTGSWITNDFTLKNCFSETMCADLIPRSRFRHRTIKNCLYVHAPIKYVLHDNFTWPIVNIRILIDGNTRTKDRRSHATGLLSLDKAKLSQIFYLKFMEVWKEISTKLTSASFPLFLKRWVLPLAFGSVAIFHCKVFKI